MLLHSVHWTLIQDHLAISKNKAGAGDLSVLIFGQSFPIFNTFAVCLFPIPEILKTNKTQHIYSLVCIDVYKVQIVFGKKKEKEKKKLYNVSALFV